MTEVPGKYTNTVDWCSRAVGGATSTLAVGSLCESDTELLSCRRQRCSANFNKLEIDGDQLLTLTRGRSMQCSQAYQSKPTLPLT
jgi:hypothetical protein